MKSLFAGACVAAAVVAGSATANTVNVSYQPSGLFGSGNLQQTVRVATPGPGYDGRVRAGLFHLTGDNGMGDFVAFCVDLVQFMHNPTNYTVDPGLFSGTVLSNIDKLFTSALGGGTLAGVIDTSLEAAGLQVALWEVMHDSGSSFDLTGGNFSMSENAAVRAQAEGYLTGIAGSAGGGYNLTFLKSDTYQDIVTVAPVPLPASGVLIGFGVAALAATRRRRSRKMASGQA